MTSVNYENYISYWKSREHWYSTTCNYGIVYSFHEREFRPFMQSKSIMFSYPFNRPITITKNYHYIFMPSLPTLSDFSIAYKKLYTYVKLKEIE